MGEELGSDIQTTPKPSPTKAVGKAIATSYCWDSDAEKRGEAPEPILNECRLLVHYKASGAYIGKRNVQVNPGVIKDAMEADLAEKLAANADLETPLEPGDEGYPTMGDPEATFKAAAAKIVAGESAADLVALLASKDWGKIILTDAWERGR